MFVKCSPFILLSFIIVIGVLKQLLKKEKKTNIKKKYVYLSVQ